MEKFNAATFKTTLELTAWQKLKYEVEDILHHVRNLKPGLRVGWIKGHHDTLGIATDLDTVGCMTVMTTAPSYKEREPYGDIDVAVYPDMSLRDVIVSWGARDGAAAVNAVYPGSIARGCERLGWIAEPDDDYEGYL